MKNKPLLLAIIYAVIYIAAFSIVYYGNYSDSFLRMIWVTSMALVLPFCVLSIKIQKDSKYAGRISGKEAVREGIAFSFYAFLMLAAFHAVIYYTGYHQYLVDSILENEKLHIQAIHKGESKATLQQVLNDAKMRLRFETLFVHITGIFVKTVVVGFFSSFIAALFMKGSSKE